MVAQLSNFFSQRNSKLTSLILHLKQVLVLPRLFLHFKNNNLIINNNNNNNISALQIFGVMLKSLDFELPFLWSVVPLFIQGKLLIRVHYQKMARISSLLPFSSCLVSSNLCLLQILLICKLQDGNVWKAVHYNMINNFSRTISFPLTMKVFFFLN